MSNHILHFLYHLLITDKIGQLKSNYSLKSIFLLHELFSSQLNSIEKVLNL